jgi:hypothetical protein
MFMIIEFIQFIAAKRAKSNKGKSKAKPQSKTGKSRKPAPKSRTSATAASSDSQPNASGSNESNYYTVPASPTPSPQDIMVPLQDSPPSRPKEKSGRRRYTLMPIRTKEEMDDPDFDPIDCIGWQ